MINSPCIKKCKLDDTKQYCTFCYRSLVEIERWLDFNEQLRYEVLLRLKIREKIIKSLDKE